MNDSEILDKVIWALDFWGKTGLDDEQVCQLRSWAKAQRRKEEAEIAASHVQQSSMLDCTKTAKQVVRKSLLRERSAEEKVREIVREELSIKEREDLADAGGSIYAATLMAPLKWAHCKTYSYDMIDHYPEYMPADPDHPLNKLVLPDVRHWGWRRFHGGV